MNCHVVQRLDGLAEQSTLMAVEHNLISAQKCKPCFTLIQDVVMGLYQLSDPSLTFSEGQFMQHFCALRSTPGLQLPVRPLKDRRGIALLNFLFPRDLQLQTSKNG